MKVKAVTENEWKDLREVRLASLKDSPKAFGLSHEEAASYSTEDWKHRASGSDGLNFIIAYDNNRPIALIGGVSVGDKYQLISMWVSPPFRGANIGVELIANLKKHAAERGHHSIVLKVSPNNKTACRLYKKCGFSVTDIANTLSSDGSLNLQEMIWVENPQP